MRRGDIFGGWFEKILTRTNRKNKDTIAATSSWTLYGINDNLSLSFRTILFLMAKHG